MSVPASENGLPARPNVYMAVLIALGLSHLMNDTIQSLIPAIYPILKNDFDLDFAKIGMITLTFQIAGALFQPAIGTAGTFGTVGTCSTLTCRVL